MKAEDVKELLSETDIFGLLEELGAEPQSHGNNIFCKTICHHGNKHKLVYFKDTKSFKCFTDSCGSMSIFDLVGRVLGLDFYSSFKYVCMKFGISYQNTDFNPSDRIDMSFFKKFDRQPSPIVLRKLPKTILNTYYELYHKSWINDGISIRSMKRFGIRFSIKDNQIIIPHFDVIGNLIGVRVRNLKEELVEDGKKYMPAYFRGQLLNHPTGAALYGLNLTKDDVEKYKAVILFESEKSVLQLDTMLPEMSIGACVSGSNFTPYQLEILKSLDINEVIIALDKEFEEVGSEEEKFYQQKIKSIFIDKLLPYFKVSIIWDTKGLLDLKDSPTDKGLEIFQELFDNRIAI